MGWTSILLFGLMVQPSFGRMPGLDPWEQDGDGKAECQDLSECPHAYNNTQPDYDPNDPSGLVIDSEMSEFMTSTMDEFLDMVAEVFPPTRVDSPDVFNGVAGRALIFLRLYDRNNNNATYLSTAKAYIDTALANVNKIGTTYVGFNWGKTGVWSVGAAIYDRIAAANSADEEAAANVDTLVTLVQELFVTCESDAACIYDDWDSGRSGLLFAAPFLQRNLPNYISRHSSSSGSDGDDDVDVIDRDAAAAVALAIVNRGVKLSSNGSSYLEWVSPNDGGKWLGQSHGSAGVIHGLITTPEVSVNNAAARGLIQGTLDHIVEAQQPSGNFPTEYYASDEDVLVQWDHGAPGVMSVLAEAALVYGTAAAAQAQEQAQDQKLDQKEAEQGDGDEYSSCPNCAAYVDSALKAADCTWERGLLVKGLMLCHGISGNTYMQLRLSNLITSLAGQAPGLLPPDQDPAQLANKFVWRALQFQRYVMNTPALSDPEEMRKPTPSPYMFYTASYESGAAAWGDLVANAQTPAAATMPAY